MDCEKMKDVVSPDFIKMQHSDNRWQMTVSRTVSKDSWTVIWLGFHQPLRIHNLKHFRKYQWCVQVPCMQWYRSYMIPEAQQLILRANWTEFWTTDARALLLVAEPWLGQMQTDKSTRISVQIAPVSWRGLSSFYTFQERHYSTSHSKIKNLRVGRCQELIRTWSSKDVLLCPGLPIFQK